MTRMSLVGEKLFLKSLLPTLPRSCDFINGFGHDISILDLGLDKHIAFKIDRAPSSVAFKRGWAGLEVAGRLAVVANISDMYSTGATPKGFMLSITAPADIEDTQLKSIVDGCVEWCEKYNVTFLGGDTKAGADLQVVGACVGTIPKNCSLRRTTARPGDLLAIAGTLGQFISAYMIMRNETKLSAKKSSEILNFLTRPEIPTEECLFITNNNYSTSSCDLSDGLADALNHFCSAETGIVIEERNLPIHPLARTPRLHDILNPTKTAFSVGDWAAAFVIPSDREKEFKKICPKNLKITVIGKFDNSGDKLIRNRSGTISPIPDIINEQFIQRFEDEGAYLDYFKC